MSGYTFPRHEPGQRDVIGTFGSPVFTGGPQLVTSALGAVPPRWRLHTLAFAVTLAAGLACGAWLFSPTYKPSPEICPTTQDTDAVATVDPGCPATAPVVTR